MKILIVFILVALVYGQSIHDSIARIGIVGAGAGASSAAYFVRQYAGQEVDIEVFEKTDVVGGRVKSMEFAGEHTEVGGSIYHLANKLFADFVKLGKFKTYNPITEHSDPSAKPPPGFTSENSLLGIWNGKQFSFQESDSFIMNFVNGLWRYGLDGKYVGDEAAATLNKFLKVYELLDKQTFYTVEELLNALGLIDLTRVSLKQHLDEGSFCSYNNASYCNEIVTGLTRVNYGQSMDLNALVGLIALIGSTDDIATVVDGNYKVLEYALWSANALVHYNSNVFKVSKTINDKQKPKYAISYYNMDGEVQTVEDFDKIIIAAPLEFASIEFEGFDIPTESLPNRPYQLTYVALVVGDIDLENYFGLPSSATQPQNIITPETEDVEFTSIFLHGEYNGEGDVRKQYKVFSRHELTSEDLDKLFKNRTTTYQTQFYAYPVLHPVPVDKKFPSILLDGDNVLYVNAMETAFSTIETEMISGKNIARIIAESLKKK